MRLFISLSLSTSLLILIFTACQPGTLSRKSDQGLADSSLYFQQVEVKDAFGDTLLSPAGQAATLSKKIIPPPAPVPAPPEFKELEGYRVQLFAGLDSLNAVQTAGQSRNVSIDSVYLFREKGLYKVQLGDYQYRYQADSANQSLRKKGFSGAWVVKRMVKIPVSPQELIPATPAAIPDIPPDSSRQQPATGKYKIQVVATATIERAQTLVKDLSSKYQYPVSFEKAGTMYKVFIGPFSAEDEARQILDSVRKTGYPDAWLVY
jgi:cell division septation protein DedD